MTGIAVHRSGTILHVITSLGGGGAERQLALYLQHCSNRWRHIVAYRKPDTLLHEEFEKAGVTAVWLGSGGWLRQLVRLLQLARGESGNVIHTCLSEANWLGCLAGRILRVPVVTTLVTTMNIRDRLDSGAYAQGWKYQLNLIIERLAARWTTRFIAITEAVKESGVHVLHIPPSHIRVVYRSVRGITEHRVRAADSGPTLISVGRLVPEKGHDFLIRTLPQILRRYPGAVLQLVGQGPERFRLERLAAELSVSRQVQFLGYQTNTADLLLDADVFVFASWFEGFGIVTAEATAMGLPVVAVDMPVRREVATTGSVILTARNELAFADAVLHVLEHLETFRARARLESAAVCERFSIEHQVQETEAVYAEVTAAGLSDLVYTS